MTTLPFDRVLVGREGRGSELSPVEFMAIPLADRVRKILAGEVRFFHRDVEIERGEALRAMTAAAQRR